MANLPINFAMAARSRQR